MVTQESLDSLGIKAADKKIQPNWWFIVLSFVAILAFVFLVLALFIQAHNSNIKDSPSIFSHAKNANSSIYYDKIEEELKANNDKKSWLCACRKKKVEDKKESSSSSTSSSDEAEKHEYAVKYKDLESLLSRFDSAQEILRRQLKDREKAKQRQNRHIDENGNLVAQLSDEDMLLKELQELL